MLLMAVGPAVYGLGLWATAALQGRSIGRVVCFDPAADAGRWAPVLLAASTLATAGAVLLLFGLPWLLGTSAWRRIDSRRATAGAWSVVLNSAALVLLCLLLRNTVGISRASFLFAWLAWTAALFWTAGGTAKQPRKSPWLRPPWSAGILIGAVTAVLGIALFGREQLLSCFNGDGTEAYELARSLRDHLLPYWEIDVVGRFGTVIVYPALICSYWNLALQLLLGEGEFSTRLSFWIWWLGVFAVAVQMTRRRGAAPDWRSAVPLALAGLLFCIWYTFYTGYYPYMADLASLGVPDVLFTLLVLLALECLRREDLAGWVALMVLASLVLYAGPVIFVLTAAAAVVWQPVPRKRILRAALGGIALLAAIGCFYLAWGWWEGSLPGWWATLREEYLDDLYAPSRPSGSRLAFVGYFLLGCGGVPAIGLLRPFRTTPAARDDASQLAWERTVVTVTLLYLVLVLGSQHRNLHYLGPLLPIPVVLWLRTGRDTGGRAASAWGVPASATLSLLVCIGLCWPVARPVFTLNRKLGAATTFLTDSYEVACRRAKLIHPLYDRGLISWEVGPHTWLGYSQLAARPAGQRPLVVTEGPPPSAGYQLLFESPHGPPPRARLYCNDPRWAEWLTNQHPLAGPDRFPWILRPIAVAPKPPDNVAGKAR